MYQFFEEITYNPSIKNFNIQYEEESLAFLRLHCNGDTITAYEVVDRAYNDIVRLRKTSLPLTLDDIKATIDKLPTSKFPLFENKTAQKEDKFKIVITTQLLCRFIIGLEDLPHRINTTDPKIITGEDEAKAYISKDVLRNSINNYLFKNGDKLKSIGFVPWNEEVTCF